MMRNDVYGDPNIYPSDNFNSKNIIRIEVTNINSLYELIEKAQQQSAELNKTLKSIEEFTPVVDLPTEK